MKLAVTGCHGSVGRRVVLAALKQGHSVVGIDSAPIQDVKVPLEHLEHPAFKFVQADLRNYNETFEVFQGCEGVVQLASIPNPRDFIADTHNSNVVITWNVLRSAAEHGIKRVAQASSVNVIALVYSLGPKLDYLPLDEDHPCRPDEPYGLSKVICELQADTITRRYPFMRVASLRLSWSVPNRVAALRGDPMRRKNDLWGYVQEDAAADAFLLAVVDESGRWTGHERFFIAAPDAAADEHPTVLKEKYWADVPIKAGKTIAVGKGFFDCSKAEQLLGWRHMIPGE